MESELEARERKLQIWEEPDLENSTGIAAGPWALDADLAH